MTNLSCTAFLAEHIQNLKIAVIGDVMLDRYFYGEVKRISPEAPENEMNISGQYNNYENMTKNVPF